MISDPSVFDMMPPFQIGSTHLNGILQNTIGVLPDKNTGLVRFQLQIQNEGFQYHYVPCGIWIVKCQNIILVCSAFEIKIWQCIPKPLSVLCPHFHLSFLWKVGTRKWNRKSPPDLQGQMQLTRMRTLQGERDSFARNIQRELQKQEEPLHWVEKERLRQYVDESRGSLQRVHGLRMEVGKVEDCCYSVCLRPVWVRDSSKDWKVKTGSNPGSPARATRMGDGRLDA